jgi:hypothetical protein
VRISEEVLLARLGVIAKVYWKPTARKVGNRRFDVDVLPRRINLTWHDTAEAVNHDEAGRTGTY